MNKCTHLHPSPEPGKYEQGNWVRHKLNGEYYQVKKVSDQGGVAVLKCQQPYEITKFNDECKVVVCQLKNLELV